MLFTNTTPSFATRELVYQRGAVLEDRSSVRNRLNAIAPRQIKPRRLNRLLALQSSMSRPPLRRFRIAPGGAHATGPCPLNAHKCVRCRTGFS